MAEFEAISTDDAIFGEIFGRKTISSFWKRPIPRAANRNRFAKTFRHSEKRLQH